MKLFISGNEKNFFICNTFKSRFWGLMGKKNIKDIYIFPNCNSIHTFFMKEAIDIIMLNKKGEILNQYINFKPWKIILPQKNVYYVIELPKNTLKEKELQFYV